METACTNNIPEQIATKRGTTSAAMMTDWMRIFNAHALPRCDFSIPVGFRPTTISVRDWYSLRCLVREISPDTYEQNKQWLEERIYAEEEKLVRNFQ